MIKSKQYKKVRALEILAFLLILILPLISTQIYAYKTSNELNNDQTSFERCKSSGIAEDKCLSIKEQSSETLKERYNALPFKEKFLMAYFGAPFVYWYLYLIPGILFIITWRMRQNGR